MTVQKYDIRRPASEGGGFEERYWSPVNAPVFGPDGRMLYIIHRVEDVTELSRTNRALASEGETLRLEMMVRGQELQEANRQLREVTEQFQAMYDQGLFAARLYLDGTVADINRSAVEVCGFNRADILDRPFWECGWWNRSPAVQAWVRNAVEQAVSGEQFRGESLYFWGDGSEHVVDFACMPIRDAAGRVVVAIATGMDITERIQVEQNQRELEAERRRAEALAEIDRAKTQFFSNVSHEFRTPLSLIIGPMTDALENGNGLTGAQLELVHRNSLRLLRLVNSLLDFARIEAGRAQATYVATDLSQLTAELASNFRSACERASLRLSVDCPRLSMPVHVDRDMWEKILLNLLSNAFKFTFEGGIEVLLSEAEGRAELSVRDTGIGIPDSEIGRVFERFYRIEGQHGRTHEGTGIGLALVQELVKLHGGTIDVDSGVGRGTVFTVRIPFGTAHLAPEHVAARPVVPTTSVGAEAFVQEALRWLPGEGDSEASAFEVTETDAFFAARAGARVLLADDNADMRDYVRRLLRERCEVRTVGDGGAALREMRERRPDLVLADVMMPEMDGFELLREIRGDPALREIPVILLSARAGEESRVEGLAAGANDYLVKPFAARELIARVGANLELARVRAEGTMALRELNESLAQRVEVEVADRMKAEEALRQAQKMEAIGQLTGGLAHDFNNLLTGISGSLELLETRLAQGRLADVVRYISTAQGSVRRAAALTQRLLAFSRRQTLDPKPTDVNRLLAGMEELIRRTVGPAIELEVVGAGGLWPTKIDPSQLENALLNLCINARDAMPDGGRITVETANKWLDERAARERDLTPGQYIAVCVTDTGTGMTPDIVAQAFDPFFTTKPLGHGTGLGLSMIHGFVRQSGGQVRIYSEPGKGTSMFLYLPRYRGGKDDAGTVQALSVADAGRGETVLVIDDEPTIRQLVVEVLEEAGYVVIEAGDGPAGLQILRSDTRIDLLISDVGLPGGLNGRQIADAARATRPALKVLFITGYAENAVVGNGHLEAGMQIITKPFAVAAFTRKVREMIER
jgi:PAS domain S-box-containing protein